MQKMSDNIHNKTLIHNNAENNQLGGISMLKLMKKRLKNQKGLTLVEVLAVVVILAIIAMIAIPAIGNIIENNRIKAIKADAVNVISAAHIYYTDGNEGTFGTTKDGKVLGADYIENIGSIQDGYQVTRDGKITARGIKGNVELKFNKVSIKEINAESPEVDNADAEGKVSRAK